MHKIKLAFKVFNSKSKFEKILIKLVNAAVPDVSHEKHLIALVQMFLHSDTTDDGENVYNLFNSYLRKCKVWIGAFKLLYVSHELINAVGQKFCNSFLSEHFENIYDLMKTKSDVEDYVHAVLASNYYNFLIIYSKYYSDTKKHQAKDPREVLKSMKQGQYIDLVQLVTFKNMIKYFTKVEESIEGSANVLKERSLLNKISALLFRDVVIVYNLISRHLTYLINYIFDIEDSLALLLDELYSDIIQVTNKLKQFIDKASYTERSLIPEINYFEFDQEFNKQEELYILEIKKQKALKGYKGENQACQAYIHEYQTLSPGKKLYKLDTKVSHFTKITEYNGPKPKDYFNLQSAEPSELDEESVAPIKVNEDGEEREERDDRDDEDEEDNQVLRGILGNGKPYKDITKTVKLEVQIPPAEKRQVLSLNGQREGSESVMFTPKSTSQYGDDDTSRDSHKFFIKKDLQTKNLFIQEDEFDKWNKKKLNLNPANF